MDDTLEAAAGQPSEEHDALRSELEATREAERAAVERLRAALIASDPALDDTLIRGRTLEEVEASYASAMALVTRLREQVSQAQAGQVPAGAPGRTTRRPVSPFEKIREGLSRR